MSGIPVGRHDTEDDYVLEPRKGLNDDIIPEVSMMGKEPGWMLEFDESNGFDRRC
jgi:hypothetical protein